MKNNNPVIKSFIDSVLTRTPDSEKIEVKFKHRPGWHPFTRAVFEMLTADPETEAIIDPSTGELLYNA